MLRHEGRTEDVSVRSAGARGGGFADWRMSEQEVCPCSCLENMVMVFLFVGDLLNLWGDRAAKRCMKRRWSNKRLSCSYTSEKKGDIFGRI